MNRLFLLCTLLSVCLAASALITDHYSFSFGNQAYAPITGTTVPDLSDDDALSGPIDLGISFPFGTQYYQQIKISTNGWIGLGPAMNTSYYNNNLASTSICPVLAPLWDDLSLEAGDVQYLLTGTVPNRVFVIQYTNAAWDYSASNQFSFQIRLFENGRIRFHYGPSSGTPVSADASIGINMSPGGIGWFLSVTPGTPPTASSTAENNAINVFPSPGEMYEFAPPVQYPNDLACVGVTGDLTPAANTATDYTVSVHNAGTNPNTAYEVKLYRGNMIEIGTVAGILIQPGQTLEFTIPWTPTVLGPETIYGRVVLPGDENTNNDMSPGLNVVVQPAGMSTVTIGVGNEMARVPLDFYWRNSLYECLYYPNELNFTNSTIYALSFYNVFTDVPNGATKIWLGTTSLADLSGGWIPSTQLTPVFDGVVNYPSGQNTITIYLQNPFYYTSGNLVMMVNRPMDSDYYSSTDYFLAQTGSQMRALNDESDNVTFDPANPPTSAELIGQFPKTTIHYAPGTSNSDPATPALLTELLDCRPNPFSAGTEINYSLKDSGNVRIGIYNLKGQLVRTLINAGKAPGQHSVFWDGRDDKGKSVSSGIYFSRLQAGARSSSLKLMLVK